MLRDMIDVTDDKSLTQGTIFNCAYCASYPNNETLGVIITARCDIANIDKVKFYNFIPAIPFNTWKKKDLLPLIKKRIYKNLINQYYKLFLNAGFSKDNLITYGFEKVYDAILSQKKPPPKEISRVLLLKDRIDCLELDSPYEKIYSLFPDEIKKTLEEIIDNKNADYFFIDEISGYESVIINLREIYELDITTAIKIPNGIELTDKISSQGLNLNINNKFCSIVGQIKSPFLELLIQRFTNNFIRIGVANPHNELSTMIIEGKK